eukprot:scaffold202706_cov14-Tisochrysis_lutea.AAC.1
MLGWKEVRCFRSVGGVGWTGPLAAAVRCCCLDTGWCCWRRCCHDPWATQRQFAQQQLVPVHCLADCKRRGWCAAAVAVAAIGMRVAGATRVQLHYAAQHASQLVRLMLVCHTLGLLLVYKRRGAEARVQRSHPLDAGGTVAVHMLPALLHPRGLMDP